MDKNYQSDNIRGGGGSNHTTTTASTTTNTTNVHHRTTPIPTEMPPIQNIELGHNVGGGDNGEGVEDFATCEELLGEVRDKMNLVIRNFKKTGWRKDPLWYKRSWRNQ